MIYSLFYVYAINFISRIVSHYIQSIIYKEDRTDELVKPSRNTIWGIVRIFYR